MSGHCSFCGETGGGGCSRCGATVEELAKQIPSSCSWATGSGTERYFAQIISPYRRNQSWYAVSAESEVDALEIAIKKMCDWIWANAAQPQRQASK